MRFKNTKAALNVVVLSFFVMGFVDVVGISTSYIKNDFSISDSLANLLPFMVFLWFFLLSIPVGLLMNKIGCHKTVMSGIFLSDLGLLLPFFCYSFETMLISFSFLGMGNTFLQVSLNPLLANIVDKNKLSGFMTLGQLVKALASFCGPIIASWMLLKYGDWKFLFLVFIVFSLCIIIFLWFIKIEEEKYMDKVTFLQCFSLLKNRIILLLFLGIICHVGLDVGINVTLPKLFVERLNCDLSIATYSSSIYFLFRTLGCLLGFIVLIHYSIHKIFFISLLGVCIGLLGLLVSNSLVMLYVSVICLGLGNANLFSIIVSQALLYNPNSRNEVSGLMIMGLVGGAIFPLIMGKFSDLFSSQLGAIVVMLFCFVYLFYLSIIIFRTKVC